MTRLSEKFGENIDTQPMTISLNELWALERAAQAIERRWPDISMRPSDVDRERILAKLSNHIRTGNWSGCRPRHVQMAVWTAFDPDHRRRRNLVHLHQFFYRELAVTTRRPLLRALAEVYLESFEAGADHTRRLARCLIQALPRMSKRIGGSFRNLPDLLDVEHGPSKLALLMVAAQDPYTMLRQAGLKAPHGAGFMAAAHLEFIKLMKPRLATGRLEETQHMLAWIIPGDASGPLQTGADKAVAALLLPWQSKDPGEKLKSLLIKALTSAYGDPRIKHSTMWALLEKNAKQVFLRWLVGATLENFLDIVSEAETNHMWPKRREFWLGLYRKGHIAEAWVAFSPLAWRIARHRAKNADDSALLAFGLQTAQGGRINTSLLIMRIGQRIVVEGSHSYKIHVFPPGHRITPTLYQARYDCENIRRSLDDKFKKAHQGDWRQWVREQVL